MFRLSFYVPAAGGMHAIIPSDRLSSKQRLEPTPKLVITHKSRVTAQPPTAWRLKSRRLLAQPACAGWLSRRRATSRRVGAASAASLSRYRGAWKILLRTMERRRRALTSIPWSCACPISGRLSRTSPSPHKPPGEVMGNHQTPKPLTEFHRHGILQLPER